MEEHPIETLSRLEQTVLRGTERHMPNIAPLRPFRIFTDGSIEVQPFVVASGDIFLGDGVKIGPFVTLRGPLYVGSGTTIGPYSEIVRSYIGSECSISHRNIVLDSVICDRSWLAGGCMICNTRLDKQPIEVVWNEERRVVDRFGAYFGQDCRVGVSVVAMPGTVVYSNAKIYGPRTISREVR